MRPYPPLDLLAQAPAIWMFLDYDGTLADFAPTPDHIQPDPAVTGRLTRLARLPRLRVAVISGRTLAHLRQLLAVDGLILMGVYGLELLTPDGKEEYFLPYDQVRPVIERVRPVWEGLLYHRQGFYLEDKGWSLAIHARYAARDEARLVLAQARIAAGQMLPAEGFILQGGLEFIEIRPAGADKARAVRLLWDRYPLPGAVPVYLGDDDKDEPAFAVIEALGGWAVLVREQLAGSRARFGLASPSETGSWLDRLIELRQAKDPTAP